ncbi:hypothetical protein ATL39_3018 [Sinobaca qinghaiensis]|uniref:Uncharacterized protein n=1 Tax=Sinobaca qinghaiensis TaxID=342944 RepID=A0A419UWT6_9BACL|nr:hypothetical protein [Sinobaca qinghaiensis]RKD69597.1 hypothetical protein ATL39_3018 [Sinobaca qinghaiensis]
MEFQKFVTRVQSTFNVRDTERKVVEGLAFIRDLINDLAKQVDIDNEDFSAVGRGAVSSIHLKSKTLEFRTLDYKTIVVQLSDTEEEIYRKEIDYLYLPNDKDELVSNHYKIPLSENLMKKYLNRFEDDLMK